MRTNLMAVLVLFSSVAAADEGSFGARVGGYGFRDPDSTIWDECRMNGVGLFGDKRIGHGPAFVEAGVDFYQATNAAVGDDHMDRISTELTVAGGMKMFPTKIISPYIQLGFGGEIANVKYMSSGLTETRLNPMGFLGVGGELKLGDKLRLGANLRFHMMAQFDAAGGVAAGAAAQASFFAKYAL
jgi:hypothetical protein